MNFLLEALLSLAIISPFILLGKKNENWQKEFLIFLPFIMSQILC